jgi:hypothetical protein
LNSLPGPKIVFAFSNPCSGAIEAIGRRRATDVRALICDGGPTAKFWDSIVKYFTTEIKVPVKPARWALATLVTPLWSLNFAKAMAKDLEKFPPNFPILSIRGWKDHLIPPKDIDAVFEPQAHLSWQKLSLPEADHLNGLKDFADEYTPPLQQFLETHASRINKDGGK